MGVWMVYTYLINIDAQGVIKPFDNPLVKKAIDSNAKEN